ncbi:DUF4062 domain-containing protein [Sphingopyxis sp. YF1]|uniref:DUF4062 domain-containing protein n=1 Tax=Sphingopyxis sp. YF1 TaxID=2482763 RepID=UPI001F610485|nr:DUF4062 domain-containing protein [Sphingopyxis sp. YF1]
MSYVGQIIDIFVSSPGDVSSYRNAIIMIVQSWNQRNGRSKKLFFNCLRWEDFVAADVGTSGQDVINQQAGDDYDIFLGVMWARFGTPTSVAESGTAEEFDRAMERHQAGEPIRVSFLFCTADVPMAKLDGVQFGKVQEFKSRAQSRGCLTRDFVDDASLINSINLILDKFANTWEGKILNTKTHKSDNHNIDEPNEVVIDQSKLIFNSEKENFDDEDIGILDAVDDFSEHNSEFLLSLNEWSMRLNAVSDKTNSTTSDLSDMAKFGRPSNSQVREILSKLTEEMDDFGNWCENEIVHMEKIMEQLSTDALRIIDMSRDFEDPLEDIIGARDALTALHDGIDGANKGITGFADSLENLPKVDKKLNKANRRVVAAHRRLNEKNRIFQEDIALCIEDLNERLAMSSF